MKNRLNIVAVTGEGTNDVPALKASDIGFAMGKSGTEIARQAAEVVLMNDEFSAVIETLLWGRNLYQGLRSFLQFQITINISISVITLVSAAVMKSSALTPIQIVVINLLMDSFASIGYLGDKPEASDGDTKPIKTNESLISLVILEII